MKPVSLRFQCFGPYMQEQFIDFTKLEQSRLFLICGETGSGKTTILDAMCYALYGRSSGGLRGDISVMRCKLAGKDDLTDVEFIFDCGGRRYKFTRSLRVARKNMIDSHNCLEYIDGQFVPIFENPKATFVNKKAEELLGLTYEQFRQVIILPQGQFEKLLVSDSSEKEKILVSLFHAEQWQRIAEEINRRVSTKGNELELEKIQIQAKLSEHGCGSLAALGESIATETAGAEELRTDVAEAAKTARHLREKYELALVESRQFEELAKKKAAMDALLSRADTMEKEEALLSLAVTAEAMKGPYATYETAKEVLTRAETEAKNAAVAHDMTEKALQTAQEKRAAHEQGRGAYEGARTRLTRLKDARAVYHSLTEKKEEFDRAELARKDAEKAFTSAGENFTRMDSAWQEAHRGQMAAMDAYQSAQSIYLRGIGSTLAENLTEGAPCPVCGSLDHPTPAQREKEHITESELEALNKAQKKASDAVSEALEHRREAEQIKTAAQQTLNDAMQKATRAKTEHDAALTRKIEGIETETALEAEIKACLESIKAFEIKETSTSDMLQKAAQDEGLARAMAKRLSQSLEGAQAAFSRQEETWLTLLEGSVFESAEHFKATSMEPEEIRRRTEGVAQYRAECHAARKAVDETQKALEGREVPDVNALKAALDEAETIQTGLNNEALLVTKRLEMLHADHADLTAKQAKYDEAMRLLEEDKDFAKRLWGRTGVGLQRYVLGVMLTSITIAANQLLKNVYGGRYQLYRTDDVAGSGQKGGLELEVFDAAHNERRSVTTLSGGEKFLMALGLAIGLSTVVQARGGGIRLEAMFIDEGFGSLDRESVNDALEVLQTVTGSAGIVGIISHVEQLAETIPAKIVITKGKNGSQSRLIC